jgi:DNA-binding transcriptional MerR regulator
MLAELPNRSLFKAPEVCEIAQLQPYVLRSWEAEFPDLGVTRAGLPGRVYRRGDVERVLRLKHLLFVEGLTLAGARRRLEEERTPLPAIEELAAEDAPARRTASALDKRDGALRRQLSEVQQGLRELLQILESRGAVQASFDLHAPAATPRAVKRTVKASKGSSRQKHRRASR